MCYNILCTIYKQQMIKKLYKIHLHTTDTSYREHEGIMGSQFLLGIAFYNYYKTCFSLCMFVTENQFCRFQADMFHLIKQALGKVHKFRLLTKFNQTWGSTFQIIQTATGRVLSMQFHVYINHCKDNYAIYNSVAGCWKNWAYFLNCRCLKLFSALYRHQFCLLHISFLLHHTYEHAIYF